MLFKDRSAWVSPYILNPMSCLAPGDESKWISRADKNILNIEFTLARWCLQIVPGSVMLVQHWTLFAPASHHTAVYALLRFITWLISSCSERGIKRREMKWTVTCSHWPRDHERVVVIRQTRDIDPMLCKCWPDVEDGGTTLKQHWLGCINVSSRLCQFHWFTYRERWNQQSHIFIILIKTVTIQLLVGWGGVFELFISLPLCRTYFFAHCLKQNIYFCLCVEINIYLIFLVMLVGYQTRPWYAYSIILEVKKPSEAMLNKLKGHSMKMPSEGAARRPLENVLRAIKWCCSLIFIYKMSFRQLFISKFILEMFISKILQSPLPW